MKKAVLLFVISVFSAFSAQAQTAEKYKKDQMKFKCGVQGALSFFKMAGFSNYPPFSWATYDEYMFTRLGIKNYTYHGFLVEPLKESLKEIGIVSIEQVVMPSFDDIMEAGKKGRLDMIFTSYYLDDTKSGLDYVYPAYFGNPFVVVSRADKPLQIEEIHQLKGMKGVIRREENVESLIRASLPTDTKIEIVDGPEDAFRKLLSGEVDFMISSPYATIAEARRFKIWKNLYINKTPLKSVKIFVAFSKMSECRQYKKKFEEAFNRRFADKAESERRMQEMVELWAEKHKDDPPLEFKRP